ncbi:MAG: cache domain-containing protein [Syntrophales bacterium]|nr:cache domain-containing protein [Syntrophales bacterium]
MKRFIYAIVVMMIMMCVTAHAQEKKGSTDEAKAMVKKAVAYVKEVGREKALAEFSNPKGKFVYKDLYISVIGMDGTLLAQPHLSAAVGKNISNMRDADGKAWIKDRIEMLKAKTSGVQDYRFSNPKTKKVEKKQSYFEIVDNMIISCGYYKGN